jgi:type II secretory pathway pseudopilin PulG
MVKSFERLVARVRRLDLRTLRRVLASHRQWRRQARAGYTLVFMMVMVAVMNIALAKATPVWSHLIQREKEEEMIFRGLQYAEAIRVFYVRYNQWPQKLTELTEDKGKGRTIRQLWNNPLSGPDGFEANGWIPMFEGQPDPCSIPQNTGLEGSSSIFDEGDGNGGNAGNGGFGSSGGGFGQQVHQVGNIVGVCSREQPEIIQREIPNWQFTVQLLDSAVFGNEIGVFPLNSANIGRSFPGVNELPQMPGVGNPTGDGGGGGPATNAPDPKKPEVPFGIRPRPSNTGDTQ